MAQLPSMLKSIDSHIYANDTQFWVSFRPEDELIARWIQKVFKDNSKFMTDNSLQLNADKTQFLPIPWSDIDFAPLSISDDIVIKPANKVHYLGVMFDRKLSFRYHAGEVCKSGFFHLRRLKCLRKIIFTDCLKTLIHAYVSSCIDFCSMAILTISKICFNRLKRPVPKLLQEPVDLTLLTNNSLPYIGCR